MKFKLIFVLFNGIIIASFVFVLLMPNLMLGGQVSADFWAKNWYLIIAFVAILGILNSYFVVNWKVFSLITKEDLTGLTALLEERILVRRRFGDQDIRLLCNTLVLQARHMEILKVEAGLREFKPDALPRYALLLGIPHLLQNNSKDIISFFEPFSRNHKLPDSEWLRFNYAFGLLAEERVTEAAAVLDELAVQKRERFVQLLSLYLLDTNKPADIPGAEARSQRLSTAKAGFVSAFSPAAFQKKLNKEADNLQVFILKKFLVEAADWIFKRAAAAPPTIAASS